MDFLRDQSRGRIDREDRAEYFTYLSDCAAAPVEMVLGDARLKLHDAPDQSYNLLVLDAFSSDAIPVHLMTQQALDLYLSKLAPGGMLVFHISNRNLDLTESGCGSGEESRFEWSVDAGPDAGATEWKGSVALGGARAQQR